MKILVTGANGLLGVNIVRELLLRNTEVHALVRPTSDLRGLSGLDIKYIAGDILDTESLDRAVKDCEVVIHAAANTSQWPTQYRYYEPVNVKGTQNVINICRKHNVSRVVYVSTANAFGNGPRENPGTELSEFNGFRYNSGYMISKYLAQQWVLTEVEKYRLPVVVVNPTFMIGPYDVKPGSGRIILMGLHKKWIACPPGGKNFIHVRDVATGICNAIEYGIPGECYLLANENLSYQEFYAKLDRVTGQQTAKFNLPGSVLKAIGIACSCWESVSGMAIPISFVNARLLCLENYYSGEKAISALRMPQTPVEKAIEDAIAWFQENPVRV